jgi:phosphatidylinositol-4-phosphate 3-kinase
VTGTFNNRVLFEWLHEANPDAEDFQAARMRFTDSAAAYCVATYALGICDRHNDNIMVATNGFMFHIDFGRFLGNAQMFGAIRRDRAPFVLTGDMAFVINGGEATSPAFQDFITTCCRAYNIVRHNASTFINLLGLMLSSGIPELRVGAVVLCLRDFKVYVPTWKIFIACSLLRASRGCGMRSI